MSDAEQMARVFKVLSVATRVRIIEILKDRPRCVNALAKDLGITPAAVSQHLRVLRDADLVTSDKRGYFVHYSANVETLTTWKAQADKLLNPGQQTPAGSPQPKERRHVEEDRRMPQARSVEDSPR